MIKTLPQLADSLDISLELLSSLVYCVAPGEFEAVDQTAAEIVRELHAARAERRESARRIRKATCAYERAVRKRNDRCRVTRDRGRVQRCAPVRARQTGARRSHRTVKRSASSSPPSRSDDPESSRRASYGGAP